MAVSCLLSMSPCVRYVLSYSLLPAPARQLYVAQLRYLLLLRIWRQFVFFAKKKTAKKTKRKNCFFLRLTEFSLIWSGVIQKAGIFRSCPLFFCCQGIALTLFFAVKAVCQGIALTLCVKGWKCCLPTSFATQLPKVEYKPFNRLYSQLTFFNFI